MVIGHQKQWQYLKRMVDSGKIPQALLFSGQEKLGKKKVALEFISLLFKESPIGHPDFLLIEPKERQIKIDQIRDLSWRLSLKPIKSFLKAAIIDQAHLMTIEAQNCFLKTLEEPRGETILILITEYPNFLLPTILSRCEILKFYPVKNEELRKFLIEKGIEKEKIEKILKRGHISTKILETAEEQDIDLIILGGWDINRSKRDLISRSHMDMIMDAKKPVLIVKEEDIENMFKRF